MGLKWFKHVGLELWSSCRPLAVIVQRARPAPQRCHPHAMHCHPPETKGILKRQRIEMDRDQSWISLSVQVASKSGSTVRMFFAKTAPDWADQGASCLCRSTSPDISSSRPQIPEVKMHPIAAAFQSWACQVFSIYEVFSCPPFCPNLLKDNLYTDTVYKLQTKCCFSRTAPKSFGATGLAHKRCRDVWRCEKIWEVFRVLFSQCFFICQLRSSGLFTSLQN